MKRLLDFLHFVFVCVPVFVLVYTAVEVFFFIYPLIKNLKK